MDMLQSRDMRLDYAGDGKCPLRALPARRLPATFCSGTPGMWPPMRRRIHVARTLEAKSRWYTGKAAEEDASPPSTAKVAPGG